MKNSPEFASYNSELFELEEILKGVESPGNFYSDGSYESFIPEIFIEEIGQLSFPLNDLQAQFIAERSKRAPFGKGEETVIDLEVRKVWQIEADKVHLSGNHWDKLLKKIVKAVSKDFGIKLKDFRTELYKFLLYDEGGFFLPHRDTEKEDGMFASLIVTLPSEHRGGELIIRHGNVEVVCDSSALSISKFGYSAFYCDCEHEVLPVQSGWRPCLVFNLVQNKGATSIVSLPQETNESEKLAEALKKFFKQKDCYKKVVWVLNHSYSQSSLNYSDLRGRDKYIISLFQRAAEKINCRIHLALLNAAEYGAAEPYYYWDHNDDVQLSEKDYELKFWISKST